MVLHGGRRGLHLEGPPHPQDDRMVQSNESPPRDPQPSLQELKTRQRPAQLDVLLRAWSWLERPADGPKTKAPTLRTPRPRDAQGALRVRPGSHRSPGDASSCTKYAGLKADLRLDVMQTDTSSSHSASLKMLTPSEPVMSFPGICPKETFQNVNKSVCIKMVTVALFIC